MDAMLRAGEVVKVAYLDWTGERYIVHIETFTPGNHKGMHTFITPDSDKHAHELIRSFRRLGYLSGE